VKGKFLLHFNISSIDRICGLLSISTEKKFILLTVMCFYWKWIHYKWISVSNILSYV